MGQKPEIVTFSPNELVTFSPDELGLGPDTNLQKPKPPVPAQPLMDFVRKAGIEVNPAAPVTEAPGIITALKTISKKRYVNAKKLADAGRPAEAAVNFLSGLIPSVELTGRMAVGMAAQQWDQLSKAWHAIQPTKERPFGNPGAASGHFLAGVTPLVGPHVAQAWERQAAGTMDPDTERPASVAGAIGTTVGAPLAMVMGAVGPQSVRVPRQIIPRVRPTTDPVLKEAIAFGAARDVPMDVAQQSGSRFIRGAKNLSHRSMFGRAAEPYIQGQQAGLKRVGEELLTETTASVPFDEFLANFARNKKLSPTSPATIRQARAAYDEVAQLGQMSLDPDALRRITDLRQQLTRDTQTSSLADTALAPYSGQSPEELGRTVGGLTATPGPEGRVLRAAGPQTPASSGGSVQSQLLQRETGLGAEASKLYGTQERIQESPLMRQEVQRTPAEIERALSARRNRMQETLGGDIPTTEELQELMHLRDRLEAGQYEQGSMAKFMEGGQVQEKYTHGHANADVHQEILQAAPGTSDLSAKHMQEAITRALETGDFSYAAQGALQVARKRVQAGTTNAASRAGMGLPAAELPGVSKTYDVQMPVNIGGFRRAMTPLMTRLEQQLPFARQHVKDAYTSLIQLMNGPENVPFSQVESALGALKRTVRGGKEVQEAGTRTAVQGLAAKEVRGLEHELQTALEQARSGTDIETYQQREMFDEAMQAVTEARKKTTEKYQVKNIREKMTAGDKPEERVFQMLTQPGDFGIRMLRRVQQHAPESVANVGRALTDHLIEVSRTQGAEAAQRAWAKVGPRTRAALYTPEHSQQLTQYFKAGQGRELVESLMKKAEDKGYEAAHRAWRELDPEIRAGLFTPAHSQRLGQYFKGAEGRELVDALLQTAKDKGYEAAERAWKAVDPQVREGLFSAQHSEQLTRHFRLGKGREVVDDLMKKANEKGYRSANTAWKNMSDRAKAELFTPQHQKNLTDYFNLAEHMFAESNPSASGYTAMQAVQISQMASNPLMAIPSALSFGALAKLLHSEGGAKLLMEGLKIPVKSPMATTAWARQAGSLIERMDDEEKALRAAPRK